MEPLSQQARLLLDDAWEEARVRWLLASPEVRQGVVAASLIAVSFLLDQLARRGR